jgi:hypothetical protein
MGFRDFATPFPKIAIINSKLLKSGSVRIGGSCHGGQC